MTTVFFFRSGTDLGDRGQIGVIYGKIGADRGQIGGRSGADWEHIGGQSGQSDTVALGSGGGPLPHHLPLGGAYRTPPHDRPENGPDQLSRDTLAQRSRGGPPSRPSHFDG